jgi:hypothetical protein
MRKAKKNVSFCLLFSLSRSILKFFVVFLYGIGTRAGGAEHRLPANRYSNFVRGLQAH